MTSDTPSSELNTVINTNLLKVHSTPLHVTLYSFFSTLICQIFSRIHLRQAYSDRKKTLLVIHLLTFMYILYCCMNVYLVSIYNFNNQRWITKKGFPHKMIGKGSYASVQQFNQPQLEMGQPLMNSVHEPFQTFVLNFQVDLEHLKLRKDNSQLLPPCNIMKRMYLKFINNGPCFFNHNMIIEKDDPQYSFTISNGGKELRVENVNIRLPFQSGNYECTTFKTFPNSLSFTLILEDAEKNQIEYHYTLSVAANEFMGTFTSDLSKLGWDPVRIDMIGNPGWGKSTSVNEMGDFTCISPRDRIKLVPDVANSKLNDHSTRSVMRYRLWEDGLFANIPLPIQVQDPPGHDVGVMEKVPQYLEYLVKGKITPGEDIVTECTQKPFTCLNKYEHHSEHLPDVILYTIPFAIIEKHKDKIVYNLDYFHKLKIPVILVVTCGEEKNHQVVRTEIDKLRGHSFHSFVIAGEHYDPGEPIHPEYIRRMAQLLLDVFHVVKSRRGVMYQSKVMLRRILSEGWIQYGIQWILLLIANIGIVLFLSAKSRKNEQEEKKKEE
ncbi:hypothetical protein FDP41_000093 [Naegleria fowleri]|uniref:Uncharacterized protein n=1 Tax=Naegleria fowleri TaxID=5763 RepID=A0A6A5CEN9_NAEFO|nr:uncharacterized protein FDP41_000093 [Naegleria fowleri]KAF0985054.1 hypothetical protein FDP41_000093 [Naegleria fowleri]